ncbi:carboxymuconolactone decarboxylase family protein [Methylobacterium radiotolerans]|uniref:carboxymuconolactone decarboxylase family protein n=1 Tax=Methylobacterium radiotolerans TaxID=31998 RepID=UPI0038D0B739
MDLTIHTPGTAPERSKPIAADSLERYGFLPNLHGIMAESPVMYEIYRQTGATFARRTLSALERQIVLRAIDYENECHHCMAVHSPIATRERIPGAILSALRHGDPLADPKLETLRSFAAAMTRTRGQVGQAELDRFEAVGYTRENLLEAIVAIGYEVLGNDIDHVAATPLDAAFEAYAWSKLEPGQQADAA